MESSKLKKLKRERRHKKVRTRVYGTDSRPRLSVFRSNLSIYAQIIDDLKSETILAISSKGVSGRNKMEVARETGKKLAKEAMRKKISAVVFDKGGFLYAGRVKAFADGAREAGLKF